MRFDIYRIPPEVWEKVFENLQNAEDLVNVSNTCAFWRTIVDTTKSHWLFELAFPSILEYLSKADVLQCRSVSKRWCYGVDYFLENNPFHRPVRQYQKFKKNQNWTDRASKMYNASTKVKRMLRQKGLMYKKFWGMQHIHKLLNEGAMLHPRCPIIGRSASKVISVRTTMQLPTVTNFFQTFGHHLWFLDIRILIRYPDPVEMLSIILNWLVHCPNLKLLNINDENFHRVEETLESDENLEAKTNLCNYLQIVVTEEMRRKLPILETLRVKLNQVCTAKFQEILLILFCSDKLQSLTLDPMIPIQPYWPLKNLSHLNASFYSEAPLNSILPLWSQVQSLELQICGLINTANVFEVISYFQSSVRNFGFLIRPRLYVNLSPEELSVVIQPLAKTDILDNFPRLRNVSVEGWLPSMNYIYGVRETLEFLQISIRLRDNEDRVIPTYSLDGVGEEMLDLWELLTTPEIAKQNAIYQSNVWNIFPKLDVLTVHWYLRFGHESEREYCREMYDRFKNQERVREEQ